MVSKTLFACFALAAAASASGPAVFKSCSGSSAIVQSPTVTFEPSTPVRGEDFTVTLAGDNSVVINGGSCAITAKYSGLTVLSKKIDVCGDTTLALPLGLGSLDIEGLSCPEKAGHVAIKQTSKFPPAAPSGQYEVHVECTADTGTEITCGDVSLSL